MTPARSRAAPYPAAPTPTQAWAKNTRKRLHYIRADDKNWPEERNQPLPHPSWMVDDPDAGMGPTRDQGGRLVMPGPIRDAMSDVQRRIYRYLQAIGKGKHNRPAIGERSRVWGTEGERPFDFTASVSIGNLGAALNLPAVTVRDNLARMTAKHYIFPMEVRRRGEGRDKNREATVWRIPPYADALRAIREDPNIATTHGGADGEGWIVWDNGRGNSRKFLTPADCKLWGLATRIPPRPQYKAAEATPPAAELASAVPAPKPAAPDLVSAPRPQKPQLPQVPPEQQAILNGLVGCYEGNRGTPGDCDLAGEILANATATAAITGREFPAEKVGEWCDLWIFNNNKVLDKTVGGADKRYWIWKPAIHSPAAFLRSEALKQEKVLTYLDWLDKAKRKAEMEQRERIVAIIGSMRQHRSDQVIWQHGQSISQEFPELWAELYAEDDKRHGGDGTGISWLATAPPAGGTRATPDEWSKTNAAAFGLEPKEWPK